MKLNVNIKLSRGMSAPEYATSGSAAVDLRAALEENEVVVLAPGERKLIPTGLSISPESSEYVAIIAGRSGLGVKKGVSLANGIGVIDSAYRGEVPGDEHIYRFLFFPSLLLIFYPAVFGIQNDADNRILEILFGIPNYKYKVWMARLILIYVEIFFILVLYAWIAKYLIYPVNQFQIAYELMYPVLFMGNLAFFFSTVTRNGNATAILIIICGIVATVLSADLTKNSMWDITLNPLTMPENVHAVIWSDTVLKNRIFLAIGSVVWMMLGLLNLQKREKFI